LLHHFEVLVERLINLFSNREEGRASACPSLLTCYLQRLQIRSGGFIASAPLLIAAFG
jgi:hypothetical protein